MVEEQFGKSIMDKSNQRKKVIDNFIIVLFPLVLILLLGPMEIYSGNISEFKFLYSQFFYYYLVATILLAGTGALVLTFLNKKFIGIFIFSISISCYIQNMFMNKYLFAADGSHMNWDSIKNYANITSLIWLLTAIAVFCTLLLMKNGEMIAKSISLFMEAILLVTVVSLIISCSAKNLERDHYVLSGEKQYSVSSGKNVIILVLDRYTNNEFEEYLSNHPEDEIIYKDFAYYCNADSAYAYTFPSLEYLLTGDRPDVSKYRMEWQNTAWHTDKGQDFYAALHDNGYTCNVYSSEEAYIVLGNLSNLVGCIDNLKEAVPRKDNILLLGLLTKMSLYKFSPYLIKPKFEISSSDAFKDVLVYDPGDGSVMYNNFDFKEKLDSNGLSIDSELENAFIFCHITGIHDLTNDENGYKVPEEGNDIDTVKAGLSNILNQYFNELKRLDVYDSSTIILMGDHGKNPDTEADPQPVFLIKQANDNYDQMRVTNAPISYDDFMATVLLECGIDYTSRNIDYGTSIFDWHADDERERTCRFLYDGFAAYTYTGDRTVLTGMIKEDNFNHEKSDKYW